VPPIEPHRALLPLPTRARKAYELVALQSEPLIKCDSELCWRSHTIMPFQHKDAAAWLRHMCGFLETILIIYGKHRHGTTWKHRRCPWKQFRIGGLLPAGPRPAHCCCPQSGGTPSDCCHAVRRRRTARPCIWSMQIRWFPRNMRLRAALLRNPTRP
jgi:hypothetical protein